MVCFSPHSNVDFVIRELPCIAEYTSLNKKCHQSNSGYVVSPMSDCVYSVLGDDVLSCVPFDFVPASRISVLVFFSVCSDVAVCLCASQCVSLFFCALTFSLCQYVSVVKVVHCLCLYISLSISLSQGSPYVFVCLFLSLHHPLCMSLSLFQASRGAVCNDNG